MRRISHRELRNSSSEVLRAVDNGESFEITNYGRVVAMIVPAHPTALDRLRAAGGPAHRKPRSANYSNRRHYRR